VALVTSLSHCRYEPGFWTCRPLGSVSQVLYSRDKSENIFQKVLIGDSSACYDSLRPQL
jgi:hypothetical protein